MNKETLTGSCDSKGLFKAKLSYATNRIIHPLLTYTQSNELVTDVENVEVVKGYMGLYGTIWQTIPEHAYKQFLFNKTGYQMSKVMEVYITVPPTEKEKPELIRGNNYILDKDFNVSSEVTLIDFGNVSQTKSGKIRPKEITTKR